QAPLTSASWSEHLAAIRSSRFLFRGWPVRVGCPWVSDAPDEGATLLEVFGVGFIIGIGFAFDFDVAMDFGAGHPMEFEHFALSAGQTDGDAKVPTPVLL